MKRLIVTALAAGLSIAAAGTVTAETTNASGHAPRYNVRQIPPGADARCEPGFHRLTYARRLNERGQAIGHDTCYVATGDPARPFLPRGERAFRWSRASGTTALPDLVPSALQSTFGRDINNAGTAVGWQFLEDGGIRAPRWPLAGGVSDALAPGSCPQFSQFITRADGISDRGSLAASDLRVGPTGVCTIHWVLKLASGEEIVGPRGGRPSAINDRNVLVGQSSAGAVKWSPSLGEIVLVPAATDAPLYFPWAWNINERNQVVGFIDFFDDEFCPVRSEAKFWAADGTERTLPLLPGGTHAQAHGINRDAVAVGYVQLETPGCGTYDPTRWRAVSWCEDGVTDLNTRIPHAVAREFQLTFASGIDDQGRIVARGVRRGEAKKPCPLIDFDPETGEEFYNDSLLCQDEYAFLLTPVADH